MSTQLYVRNSKNLIDADILVGFGAEKVGENEYYFEDARISYGKHIWDNTENYQGQVTISYDGKYVNDTSSKAGVIFYIYYTDGTFSYLFPLPIANVGYQKYNHVSKVNKVVDYIECTLETGSTKSYLKNIMLNKGTKALPYTPYNHMSKIKPMIIKRNSANLISFPYRQNSQTSNGLTWTVQNDGSVRVVGTSTGYTEFVLNNIANVSPGVKYVIRTNTTDPSVSLCVRYSYIENGATAYSQIGSYGSGSGTIPDNVTPQNIYFQITAGKTVDTILYPTVNEWPTAEPYYIGDKIKHQLVTRNPANLIPLPYQDNARTVNGITFTVNKDGTVMASGTATADVTFILKNLPLLGTYTLSGTVGGSKTTYYMAIGSSDFADIGNGISRTYAEEMRQNIFIRIVGGATVNSVTFYPMLNKGASPEPYFSNL